MLGVVVFYNHVPKVRLEMALIGLSPKWLTKKVIVNCFDYCFNVVKVNRLYTQVTGNNTHALEINKRLGLKELAILPDYVADMNGVMQDNHVFSMTKEECKWLWQKAAKAKVA